MEMDIVKSEGSESTALIRLALDKGVDTDKLEKLIELRNKELDRQAKADFEAEFSKMQAEFPPITKTVPAYNDAGAVMYYFASLDVLQKIAGPIISKHGFSYAWHEEKIEGGKRAVMSISGYGHTRTNFFDIPQIPGTKMNNAIQVVGIMSSYGHRYTFKAGFGLTIEGEDDDAASLTFADGVKYADFAREIAECKSLEELKAAWPLVYKKLEGDRQGQEILGKAKDARKKELSK